MYSFFNIPYPQIGKRKQKSIFMVCVAGKVKYPLPKVNLLNLINDQLLRNNFPKNIIDGLQSIDNTVEVTYTIRLQKHLEKRIIPLCNISLSYSFSLLKKHPIVRA